MNLMKKVNAFVLGLAVLLAFGCGKDDDPINNPSTQLTAPKCQLLQDSSSESNTTKYFYNAQGQLIRTQNKSNVAWFYEQLDYDNTGKLTRISNYNKDSILYSAKEYQYNTNDQLIKSISLSPSYPGGPLAQSGYQTYIYNTNGSLAELKFFSGLQSITLYASYVYSYQANGIIEEKQFSYSGGSATPISTWIKESRYDGKKNPYFGTPYAVVLGIFNEHNLISVKGYDGSGSGTSNLDMTFTYQYNSDDYPISWSTVDSLGNISSSGTFNYNCQ